LQDEDTLYILRDVKFQLGNHEIVNYPVTKVRAWSSKTTKSQVD